MKMFTSLVPRNLIVRKARTLLTALGIALGVAAMVATGIVRESATRSVANMLDHAAGRADLAVIDATASIVGSEGFDAAVLEQVAASDGVAAVAPLWQAATLPSAQLDDWQYSFIPGNFNGMALFGVDPQASRAMGHYRLVAGEDLSPDIEDALLLSRRYAAELGVSVGDGIELVAPAGQVRFTVSGILASDGLARLNRGQVGVTTLAVAQEAFERPGRLDQIDVVAAPGVDTDDLKAHLQARLGDGFRVSRPAAKGAMVDQMLQSIARGLGFIGVLGLVVGGFLIYNTFATTVTERTRELGLLRALGSSRGQIVGLVLSEAAVLGLGGALLGIPFGIGLASGMNESAGATMNSEVNELTVLPEHIVTGLLLGLVMATVSALVPALRASRLPVVESIQQRRRGDGHATRGQVIAGLVLVVPTLAATIGYAIHPVKVRMEPALGVFIALLVGVGLMIPLIIPPLERWMGAALGVLGVEGRLGGRNLARSPGRSALTAAALMFGLAWVIIIGGVFISAKNLTDDYAQKTLDAELWVYAPRRLPRSLADELESMPEVRLARPAASIPTRIILPDAERSDVAVIFTAIDPERSQHLDYYFAPDGGDQEQAIARITEGGAVMIANPLREWYGLDVGDEVRLQTSQGAVDFEIVGVTMNMTANGYVVVGVYPDAVQYFGIDGADIIAVNLEPEADADDVGQRIVERWGDTHHLRFESDTDLRARAGQLSDSFAAFSDSAVLVGVAVAVLGVTNTLLMNVLERRREIGMLRSMGMTRGQIVRLVLAEAAALGVLGGVLGVGLGAWLARFVVSSSSSATGYAFPFVFPVEDTVTCIVIAAVVPLVAGLWPGWRGARVNIIEAMRSE